MASEVEVGNKIDRLKLKDISWIGGEQEDLNLLNDVADEEDDVIVENDTEDFGQAFTKNELMKFMDDLGVKKIKERLIVIKDEVEEEAPAEQIEVPGKDRGEGKKEKKHSKRNKYKKNAPETVQSIPKVPIETKELLLPNLKEKVVRHNMLFKPGGKWYEKELNGVVLELPKEDGIKLSWEQLEELRTYSSELLEADVALYHLYKSSTKNRSNTNWIRTVLKSGTINDKMAAHIVLVQDSPLHNLGTLDVLVKMADPKGKRECLMAVDTLRDLFIGDLLPENRKLIAFEKQPFASLVNISAGNRGTMDCLLLLWYFESELKQRFWTFVDALDKLAKDKMEKVKQKAIKTMFTLLSSVPEQEQFLLSTLVNKVGDPNRKIASHSSMLLCELIGKHSDMKGVVASEVERLLFRTNISPKARYYAICFLNQMMLDQEDEALAAMLVSLYFALFKAATKSGEVETKMMSALLTGVNRAFPYAKIELSTFAAQMDVAYKIVQTVQFNVAIQALLLIYHALDSQKEFTDRFYCSIYRKLLDPEVKTSSKQAMFLNLLFKCLKKDEVNARVAAFIKRIFQISFDQYPPMICGSLFLVSEVLRETSRELTLSGGGGSLGRIEDDDDEEEKYEDIPMEESEQVERTDEEVTVEEITTTKKGSWVHRKNLPGSRNRVMPGTYDPTRRNPTFAGAEGTCVWELATLRRHFHPSVSLFANTLANGDSIQYTGDPLQDFTLSRFLDRFVYRNPKKPSGTESVRRAVFGRRSLYHPKGVKALPVSSETFIAQTEASIPADELFFYKYFSQQQVLMGRNADDDDEDIESVGSDEFNELLEKFETGTANDEFGLDFAKELQSQRKAANRKKGKKEDQVVVSEDEEPGFEDDDFAEAFKDFDEDIEEACEDLDDEEDEEFEDASENYGRHLSKSKRSAEDFDEDMEVLQSKKRRSKKNEFNSTELFASAEEFAALLDENAKPGPDTSGSEAFLNRDRSHAKQLNWEQQRDQWVRGVDWKSKKRGIRKGGRGRGRGRR